MRTLRAISSIALLAATAAIMTSAPRAARADAAICPYVLMQYCVAEKDKSQHTAWTNTCLAEREGLRLLYKGACKP